MTNPDKTTYLLKAINDISEKPISLTRLQGLVSRINVSNCIDGCHYPKVEYCFFAEMGTNKS